MEMTASPPQRSGRLTLIMLICLFAVPPLLGWLYFLNPQWLPDKRNNHGELIHPAIPVQGLPLTNRAGKPVAAEFFSDSWHMAVIVRGRCRSACQQQLQRIDQVRRAVGGSQQRIRPLLLLLPDSAGMVDIGTAVTVPALTVSVDGLPAAESTFGLAQIQISDYSFVIDPMGALMMKHNNRLLSQKQVLEDMEKLLKISQSWVKGADYGHK